MARHRHVTTAGPALALALGTAAMIVGTAVVSGRRRRQLQRVDAYPDDAPARTRRALKGRTVVGNSVTIARPRRATLRLLARLRQPARASWRTSARSESLGGRPLRVDDRGAGGRPASPCSTEITEERDGELIAWRSLPDSDVEAEGRVGFRDAARRARHRRRGDGRLPPARRRGRALDRQALPARAERPGPPRAPPLQDADGDRRDRHLRTTARPQDEESTRCAH